MRCPECEFILADARDICPKCLVDLREYKLGHGLPVTNSDAPYEQLYEETTGEKYSPPAEDPLSPNPSIAQPLVEAVSPAESQLLQEIDALFDEAFVALSGEAPQEDLGLGHEQFVKIDRSEEIDLLFELSDESLLNPEIDSKYTEEIFVSGDRVLESQLLKAELAKVERSLDAPLPTLKELQIRAQKYGLKGWSLPKALEFPAVRSSICVKLLAFDWAVVVLASLALSLYSRGGNVLSFVSTLFDSGRVTDFVGMWTFVGYFLPTLVLVAFSYWLASLWLLGRTFGMKRVGVQVLTERGKPIGFANAFVRATLAPWVFLVFGVLNMQKGRRSWSDLMARTVLVEEKAALRVLAENAR